MDGCVCVCVCVCMCVCVWTDEWTSACVSVRMRVCVRTYARACVYACMRACVYVQNTRISGDKKKKKFIHTSYNLVDVIAYDSIVNNNIITERIYNFSHSLSSQSITQIVYTVMSTIFRYNVLHRLAIKRPLLW